MYIRTSYGSVWVSEEPPYFRDWQGRQLYKYHDFMMLNPVRGTQATSAAIAQAIDVLKSALGTTREASA